VEVGWYSTDEGRELELNGWGTRAQLLDIMVVRPEEKLEVGRVPWDMQHDIDAEFGDEITLLGYELPPDPVPATGTLELDLFWQVLSQPNGDRGLLVELVDSGGQATADWGRPPISSSFPSADWRAGDSLRSMQRLTLPHDLEPGRYRLRLKLLDESGRTLPVSGSAPRETLGGLVRWEAQLDGEYVDLAPVKVTRPPESPPRTPSFEMPFISQRLDAELGQGVHLLGYDLDTRAASQGEAVRVILYWNAEGATDRPYKVFTHLGEDGRQPMAQHDGLPGGGCCPTDTWVEGEIVTDPHVIALGSRVPPGTYRLSVGMYDEATDERLPILEAAGHDAAKDRIHIAWIEVLPSGSAQPRPARPGTPERIYLPEVLRKW
jgi:hypothetical protein